MNPRPWPEVRALFDELVALEASERAARLSAIAAADPTLHRTLSDLLVADEEVSPQLSNLESRLAIRSSSVDTAASHPDPLGLVGQTISHYRILESLDSGGMGVVYRAEDGRLGRIVALKFLLPQYAVDAAAKERFLREARSAGKLDHANLCTIFDVGEAADGRLFLAMPLYPGETLKSRLARKGALPVEEATVIASQIASGLACAHAAGIVHRDLKPGNVMLLPDGTVKVLDFGLARAMDGNLTATRERLGTVAYMAPEQIEGASAAERSDLWALGVMLYEMLTGERPFRGKQGYAVAYSIVHEEPVGPSSLRGDIPAELSDLVRWLLQKEPGRRCQTASEFLDALPVVRSSLPPARVGLPGARRVSIGIAAAALGATLLAIDRSRDEPLPEPGARRIVVAVFENQTGDESLSPLGRMAAEWITEGLSELSYLEVLDARLIPGVWNDSASSPDLITRLAEGTAAGTLIKGTYSLYGDSIRLNAQITDAEGARVLQRVGPVSAPLAAPHEGVDQLVSRVMAATASIFDPLTAPWEAESRSSAPTFEAYQAYSAGLDAYNMNRWDQSGPLFERAIALDTTFLAAGIWAALSRMLLAWGWRNAPYEDQQWSLTRADSIAAEIDRRKTRLEPYDRHFFDWYLSMRAADYDGAYSAARRMVETAPGSYVALREAAFAARRAHRSKEALERLERLDLEHGLLRDSQEYWWALFEVSHRLEDYEREIMYAQQARLLMPWYNHSTVAEARAHAAAGRIDAAARLVQERAGQLAGYDLLEIAAEFSAHGFDREARPVLERVEPWVTSQPANRLNSDFAAQMRADSRFMLGDYAGARAVYEERSWSRPLHWFVKGRLGMIAVEQGDTSTAREIYGELLADTLRFPQRDWHLVLARAGLAARIGDLPQAAIHAHELRRAGGWIRLHIFPELAPLRGYPPFESMVRPIG